MLAVIELQGHQYIVQAGTKLVVDFIDSEEKTFSDFTVLAVFDEEGKEVQVGAPSIKAKITADILGSGKGEKINVLKFKRKNRYERNKGFRPLQTTLIIKDVALHG
ncbi:50S ribosomal protein L21 [Patescibacteria group bacterium]|nr:50S ribosomal protein L21 [Patescibacteria group bacterium]